MTTEYPRPNLQVPKKPRANTPPLVTAVVGVAILSILVAILYPVFRAAQPVSNRTRCISSVKSITLGFSIYSDDYDELLPPAPKWMDLITKLVNRDTIETQFHDREGVAPGEYGYAFRTQAGKLKKSSVTSSSEFMLVFDTDLHGRNAVGDPSSLPSPGRHQGMDVVGYLDGHVKALPVP